MGSQPMVRLPVLLRKALFSGTRKSEPSAQNEIKNTACEFKKQLNSPSPSSFVICQLTGSEKCHLCYYCFDSMLLYLILM